MTLALHFHNDKIQVSRSGESERFVFADGRDFLPTEFAMTEDAARPVSATERDAHRIVKLHVEDDGMEIRMTCGNAEKIPVDTKVLRGVFAAVRAADDTDTDELVIVGAENRLLQKAAIASGFSEVAFISPAAAAIRWAGTDTSSTVAVLFCNEDGSTAWTHAAFNDEGHLICNDSDRFSPSDPTQMDHGLGKFLAMLQAQECPVDQVIVTGSDAETESVKTFLSAIAQYGYNIISNADAVVLGASMPPLKSKYGQMDDLIEAVLTALSASEFEEAIETFEKKVLSLFDSPSAQVQQTTDQLRLQMRSTILAAAQQKQTLDAESLYEQTLRLSETDDERGEVYDAMLRMYVQAGKIAEAEEAAITSAFYDPRRERTCMGVLRSYRDNPSEAPRD